MTSWQLRAGMVRCCAPRLTAAGVAPRVVMEILGHSRVAVT
ncbi:hypothetical protein AB0L68_15785 [Streptomyces sp. NPDC052164]